MLVVKAPPSIPYLKKATGLGILFQPLAQVKVTTSPSFGAALLLVKSTQLKLGDGLGLGLGLGEGVGDGVGDGEGVGEAPPQVQRSISICPWEQEFEPPVVGLDGQ